MKISENFNLNKTQFELDFVDIDPSVDTPLFLDPYFISKCDFPFAVDANNTLKTFFEYLLKLLKKGNIKQAEEMFSYLGESNDVCMGLSKGKPRGKGMGPTDTTVIFKELLKSKAVESGLIEDIEDFRIFVPNVDKDKVSDMTANIIKWHLIEYTINQCNLHNIPLYDGVPSGMFWNLNTMSWDCTYTKRLVIDNRPILLVPKRIVSYTDKYTAQEYKQHFILNFLQNEHLRLQTSLVQKRKDGTLYVTKKSIDSTEKIDKEYIRNFTKKYPDIFENFKSTTYKKIKVIEGNVLEKLDIPDVCDFLIDKLECIPSGTKDASNYHNLIIGILELLLYPSLSNPKKEREIHDGRKRIDIVFDNASENGFFHNLNQYNHDLPCSFIYVECKNYTGEVANPELDQLSGRFSISRGKVGILSCRNIDQESLFIKRCADTFHDGRGLILPLTDNDLKQALKIYPEKGVKALEDILQQKFGEIVFAK